MSRASLVIPRVDLGQEIAIQRLVLLNRWLKFNLMFLVCGFQHGRLSINFSRQLLCMLRQHTQWNPVNTTTVRVKYFGRNYGVVVLMGVRIKLLHTCFFNDVR